MRGDLVDVLYQESLKSGERAAAKGEAGGVRYSFGKYATELKQDGAGVNVVFSDGTTGRYNLVVGADGQGSRTRRMAFGEDRGRDVFHPFGLWTAFFSTPREECDGDSAKCYNLPNRLVSTRTGGRPVTQVYLCVRSDTEELRASTSTVVDEQKELWRRLFDDCAWQRERLLKSITNTQDFYTTPHGQVKMDCWSEGRVVLIGDAGYGPNLGMGTTVSLVGAYILAGELARHGDDVPAALKAYEEILRPFIDIAQKKPPGVPALLYPQTEWGVWFLQTALGIFTWLRIDKAINMLTPEDKGGWAVPDYPELATQI